jgi:ABC-type antimicrobial peptide transport system permease subunit
MRGVARILLLIPLGLLMAFGAGSFFLMLATVISAPLAGVVFGALNAFAEVVFGLAMEGEDPTALAVAASWQGFKLAGAILVAPVLITAIASELFRLGGGLVQMSLCGLLAAALPAAVIGLNRLPSSAEGQVLAALFLTGVVTGAVYWLIAGRGAGAAGARDVSAPPASAGS